MRAGASYPRTLAKTGGVPKRAMLTRVSPPTWGNDMPSGRRSPQKEEAGMPRAQIKDEKTYRALRREGNSEEKSARIANAAAGSSRKSVGARGGKSGSYDDWTKKDLLQRARELGISGRSSMSKAQLIDALRNH
jgi:hypothetical protein